MVDPNDILAAQRQRVCEADAAVEVARSEAARERQVLRGMEAMDAAFRAIATASLRVAPKPPSTNRSGGRQPGAISKEWRSVLGALSLARFRLPELTGFAKTLNGRDISQGEAKRRVDLYIERGFVEALDNDFYEITKHAIEKFGLPSPKENGEVIVTSPDVGGAPTPTLTGQLHRLVDAFGEPCLDTAADPEAALSSGGGNPP